MKSRFIIILAAAAVLAWGIFYIRAHRVVVVKKTTVRGKAAPLKSAGVKKPPAKKRALTAPAGAYKKFVNPKVAIVMDDFGYNMNGLDELFAIRKPITLSILPRLAYSSEIARRARTHGFETILHLPLESHRKDVREEFDTIKSGMDEKTVTAILDKEIMSVPGITGVSNHMGSRATEDKELMAVIFARLKQHNLCFLDSLTSEKSVCREVAASAGLRYGRRDIFLDNSNDAAEIRKQLSALKKMAFRRGRAIAICHDRRTTIAVLASAMPEMAADGIEFVDLSELMK